MTEDHDKAAEKSRRDREGYHRRKTKFKAMGLTARGCTPEEERRRQLWHKFKMTPDDWDVMWSNQHGSCGICNDPLRRGPGGAAVDHDHETGKIRMLLCNCCNTALGKFKDDPTLMRRAAAYVETFR